MDSKHLESKRRLSATRKARTRVAMGGANLQSLWQEIVASGCPRQIILESTAGEYDRPDM